MVQTRRVGVYVPGDLPQVELALLVVLEAEGGAHGTNAKRESGAHFPGSLDRHRAAARQPPGRSPMQRFRHHTREALRTAASQALAAGLPMPKTSSWPPSPPSRFLDESVLNSQNPIFADWLRKPLQEELFGTHMAGEIFFQHLQQLLGRNDSRGPGRPAGGPLPLPAAGFRRPLQRPASRRAGAGDAMAAKIRRIRGEFRPLPPAWMLPPERCGRRRGSAGAEAGWPGPPSPARS